MYTKLELLGKGHFGEVWKEFDSYTDRVYATKYIPLGRSGFQDNLDEAKLMVASESRYTVKVFSASRYGDEFVIRTEYMKNGTVESACAAGPVPMKEFYSWFPDICRGLAHLHGKGVLHRDIKPANVLIDAQGDVKLGDFGLALMEGTHPEHGSIAYTPTLTPESDFVDSQAGDIYALGCLAYRILNGEDEWQRQIRSVATGPNPGLALRTATKEGRFPDRRVWPPYITAKLKRALLKSLNVDPGKRFASSIELCEAVERSIPKIYWSYDPSQGEWAGESKDPRDKRLWKLNVASGKAVAKRSINGSSFRRVTNLGTSLNGLNPNEAIEATIRAIEAA
ncbi:serine/threonine-protein kinase [Paeniglutamicibacter sp.]|uniref:serine/threonine-protein kinase n=1 Tax=Paeniglutamicibacter sp. TaxID=1934391 RepID=UPI00398A3721